MQVPAADACLYKMLTNKDLLADAADCSLAGERRFGKRS